MKYVVTNEFLDRFDKMRHCKPGETHVPATPSRAAQLIELGFIAVVEEQKESNDSSKQKDNRRKKADVIPKDDGHGAEDESK